MNLDALGFFTLCLAFLFIKPVMNSSDADREWLNRMIESMEVKPTGSLQYPARRQYRVGSNISPPNTALERILQTPESLKNRERPGEKRVGVCCNPPATRQPIAAAKRKTDYFPVNKFDVDTLKALLRSEMYEQPSSRSTSYTRHISDLQHDWDSSNLFGTDKRKRQETGDDSYFLDAQGAEDSPGGLPTINDRR
ncbi:uncharacterized protein LOC101845589 [Aplysia californica]|uniref:Uncharacterized protein LOC101845589 n=1 Tax=Aplysia californica TaxID=6500 RepID=A0ABM0JBB6_APLCA|nr:uncharacterized protein LOC101845589 [Aplysia californica]